MAGALREIIVPRSVDYIGDHALPRSETLTVLVTENSYAQQYCQENGVSIAIQK